MYACKNVYFNVRLRNFLSRQENTAFDLDPSQATFCPWTLSGEKHRMGPARIFQHKSISSGLVLFKCLGFFFIRLAKYTDICMLLVFSLKTWRIIDIVHQSINQIISYVQCACITYCSEWVFFNKSPCAVGWLVGLLVKGRQEGVVGVEASISSLTVFNVWTTPKLLIDFNVKVTVQLTGQ